MGSKSKAKKQNNLASQEKPADTKDAEQNASMAQEEDTKSAETKAAGISITLTENNFLKEEIEKLMKENQKLKEENANLTARDYEWFNNSYQKAIQLTKQVDEGKKEIQTLKAKMRKAREALGEGDLFDFPIKNSAFFDTGAMKRELGF